MLFTIGIQLTLSAQNEKIILWEEGIPGEIDNENYMEEKIIEDGRLTGVNHVTIPEMTVYQPQEANGTAVIICPGGGYGHLAIDKEGFKIAAWFNTYGITAFVLKYRLPSDSIMKDKTIGPLQDIQRAVRLVRHNAQKYSIDSDKVGVMGFSAGGHLASTISTHYQDKVYKDVLSVSAKQDFSILIYPVISMLEGVTHQGSKNNLLGKDAASSLADLYSNEKQVDENTPITFLVHATDDDVVPVENSLSYYKALHSYQIPTEMHIYQNGGHGFGLGNATTHDAWPTALQAWLKLNYLAK
ncbi:MAG: alpha/beta hydrolase [Leeuwenhoekiella sp.]